MSADILLFAIIAAGLVYWLRSILGTRHGEERDRPNPFERAPLGQAKQGDVAPQAALPIAGEEGPVAMPPALPAYFTMAEGVADKISAIAQADRSFSLTHFAQGAGDAFAFVVESFADGDRNTLKDLLAPPVYAAFDAALRERDTRGETVETEIHAVRKAELINADLRDDMIYLTVRFTADETCVIRDKEGVVLSGHPDHITEMIDVWMFGRSVKAKDPRWLVFETRDGDVVEEHKTPLPEA